MATVLTKENFENEVLKSDLPVLVDFWASWCGPCRMLSPLVDTAETAHAGKLKVGKINVDEQEELASQFGIMSIPTLILFKGGKKVAVSIALISSESLESFIQQAL